MSRYALYFLPEPGSALAGFGGSVLGGDGVAPPAGLEGVAAVNPGARVYGFHATLKAPMRLADGFGEADVIGEAGRLAAAHPPVRVGALEVAALGRFIALVPAAPPPALALLAAECTAALDPLRAPATEAERARRRPETLGPRGRALLDRWGYPHVFEAFRFHMTLTDALPEAERGEWLARLAAAYAASGPEPLTIEAVCLLRQDDGGAFRPLERFPFGGHDG